MLAPTGLESFSADPNSDNSDFEPVSLKVSGLLEQVVEDTVEAEIWRHLVEFDAASSPHNFLEVAARTQRWCQGVLFACPE